MDTGPSGPKSSTLFVLETGVTVAAVVIVEQDETGAVDDIFTIPTAGLEILIRGEQVFRSANCSILNRNRLGVEVSEAEGIVSGQPDKMSTSLLLLLLISSTEEQEKPGNCRVSLDFSLLCSLFCKTRHGANKAAVLELLPRRGAELDTTEEYEGKGELELRYRGDDEGNETLVVTTDSDAEFGNIDEGRTLDDELCSRASEPLRALWNGVDGFKKGD